MLYGNRPEPLPAFRGTVEDPAAGKIGICCSGGGIRSAAYNLGALQSLQEDGELENASYLAAVSGGSYIAAAFWMVTKSWNGPCRPMDSEAEGHDDSNPALLETCRPFARGSPEEQYVRNRSSYLAPDGMGKLFLAYRIVLGLLFNLLFVSLPLFGAALVLGEVFYRPLLPQLVGDCKDTPSGCVADIPRWWWIVPLGVVAASMAGGVWGMIRRSRTDRRRRFFEMWPTRLLLAGGVLALVLVALPALVDAFHSSSAAQSSGAPEPGIGISAASVGFVGMVAGILGQLRQAFATPKQAAEELSAGRKALRGLGGKARLALAYVAGAVIGPLLLLAAVVFGLSLALAKSPDGINWWVVGGGGAAFLLFGLFYALADITAWSLHPVYKRRLCTAFALKRVSESDLTDRERDRAEAVPPVEAPASDVGVAIERDFDNLVQLSDTALHGRKWPTLLVCAAANVSDPGATPPGRRVTSFTFSAYSIGGPLVGGAPTMEFEKAFGGPNADAASTGSSSDPSGGKKDRVRRVRDFSLPAAVAVSGAAISPSMGKMTRRPLTFLLALANIRLGVWMPNPRWVMGMKKRQPGWFGRPRPLYLLRELLGRNRVNGRYLYVTDGGHYENLGLVELLRRGCTEIYCFDASGGEAFDALGDAVSLARSELSVEINVKPDDLFPSGDEDRAKADTVSAPFSFRDGETGEIRQTGTLVYARNVLTDNVPWDVTAQHKLDPRFPHNTTADQLYTDQKFEGYRRLGELAGRNALELMKNERSQVGSASAAVDSGGGG
jgi:hypothetical protein